MSEAKSTIREKTEQVLTPIKAELIWMVLIILAVIAAYKLGVIVEKIGFLEDADIARQQEVKNVSTQK